MPGIHQAVANGAAVAKFDWGARKGGRSGSVYTRDVIDMAGDTADMGLWVCDLPDETIDWTNGTYDLFGLPRGIPVRREQVLEMYSPSSLLALDRVRSDAIMRRSGFTLDTEIFTRAGQRRWMRISARVERASGRAVRLLGVKQDITEWRQAMDELHRRSAVDAMTGLASRARFDTILSQVCDDRALAALLLIDVDGFKTVNDTVGHAGGDDCIRKLANRLASVCREATLVARLGGDEFGVIVTSADQQPETLANDIVLALGRPVQCAGRAFNLAASVGVASIPRGVNAATVFELADQALYDAKFSGGAGYRIAC